MVRPPPEPPPVVSVILFFGVVVTVIFDISYLVTDGVTNITPSINLDDDCVIVS